MGLYNIKVLVGHGLMKQRLTEVISDGVMTVLLNKQLCHTKCVKQPLMIKYKIWHRIMDHGPRILVCRIIKLVELGLEQHLKIKINTLSINTLTGKMVVCQEIKPPHSQVKYMKNVE